MLAKPTYQLQLMWYVHNGISDGSFGHPRSYCASDAAAATNAKSVLDRGTARPLSIAITCCHDIPDSLASAETPMFMATRRITSINRVRPSK